ncbi:MAG TPA: ATP-binding protein [Pyrinomonadaceae bacterium]|nr:ATP-binding protein [Pyrinomonadaceae bacterium]
MNLRTWLAVALGVALIAACVLLFASHAAAAWATLGGACAGYALCALASAGARRRSASEALSARAGVRPVRATGPDIEALGLTVATAVESGDVPAAALLEATMDSMREGVLVVDGGMRVIASNNAARDLFGASTEPFMPRRLSELTRNPAVYSAFAAAVARGERTEVKIETPEAERRVFDLHVAPLGQAPKTAGETARGAVGVFFDITRLERLEHVRQEFLSNVSHELRTPLTAILTFVETLEEGAVDEPENNRRFLAVIRRNAERMHNLINDILELSAIETGTVAVELAPVRLSTLVGDCATALAARASERGVELCNLVPAETIVHADPRRLEQMLTNLIDNAVKFSAERSCVTVSHERTAGRDRISVTDAGEGIAPEHLARIFERFYRVDRARSRALGGTGLGLAIVKHLARAHGGEANVRSTPGHGSTFTIELPVREEV